MMSWLTDDLVSMQKPYADEKTLCVLCTVYKSIAQTQCEFFGELAHKTFISLIHSLTFETQQKVKEETQKGTTTHVSLLFSFCKHSKIKVHWHAELKLLFKTKKNCFYLQTNHVYSSLHGVY